MKACFLNPYFFVLPIHGWIFCSTIPILWGIFVRVNYFMMPCLSQNYSLNSIGANSPPQSISKTCDHNTNFFFPQFFLSIWICPTFHFFSLKKNTKDFFCCNHLWMLWNTIFLRKTKLLNGLTYKSLYIDHIGFNVWFAFFSWPSHIDAFQRKHTW